MWNLFRKKNIKEEQCDDASAEPSKTDIDNSKELPKLRVLGSIGCVSCKMQLAQMQEALKELGYPESAVEYVEDIEVALSYGIMSVPAVVVGEEVVGSGKVMKKTQLIDLLKNL